MAEAEKPAQPQKSSGGGRAPTIKITAPAKRFDAVTFSGLFIALGLIAFALYIGGDATSFFNAPALLIVLFGTIAVTTISYSGQELKKSIEIIKATLIKDVRKPSVMARQLIDIAALMRIKGPLALSNIEPEIRKDKFLYQGVMFIADGYKPDEIERILSQDIEALIDRHRRSAGIARRAGEVAPAMGLIGTLVGLVQMLNQLDDPSMIGPAMAIALLTTFYGAILSTVFFMPLAAKLERNSAADIMIKDMILAAMISMSRKDHPRKLEHELNMLLPPGERIRYFSQ